MPPKRKTDYKPQPAASAESSRNLRKIRPAPLPYSPSVGLKRWEDSINKTPDDVERRRKRRESDAKCRANLSSCFSFLKSQVQERHEHQVKMSKEALLYNSIDQIQYLEAVLVLLQQNQDISLGEVPSQPIDILQGLHKEFISQKQGVRAEDLVLQGGPPRLQRRSGKKSEVSVAKPPKVTVVTTSNKQATLKTTPEINTPKKSAKTRKRAADPGRHTTIVHATPEEAQKRTVPNILLKKVDGSSDIKSYYVSMANTAQQVPGTPTHPGCQGRSYGGGSTEFGVHQVPGTPVKHDIVAKHYRIKGKDVTPSKLNPFDLCGNCQIEGINTLDLTCYEDPEEWKEESFDALMRTPQRTNPDDFRTPTLKRKALILPTSTGRRSKKRLFTPDKKGRPLNTPQSGNPAPTRTYSKRATAARTRPWDAVAWKVTSPYQPYSGLHRQRKESRRDMAGQLAGQKNLRRSHRERQLKLMEAMGLTGNGTRCGTTIEHCQDSVLVSYKDKKMTFETAADDGCKSNSQDSLSILEVPSLPQNIRNLISIEGASPHDTPHCPMDVSLGVTSLQQLDSLLEDDYSPLEMYPDYSDPGNLGELSGSCGSTLLDQDLQQMTFDLSPRDLLYQGPVTVDQPDINIEVLSPEKARGYYESAADSQSALIQTPQQQGSGGDFAESGPGELGGLDGLIRKNVWKGARNQDITLTQLQTDPIFGSLTSVYSSPQWAMAALGHREVGPDRVWVDVESSESTEAQESWDTTDFLSSIDSGGPSGLHEDYSSGSQSSNSPSSADLEPGCAASRAIEEYQVVPHYHPEE